MALDAIPTYPSEYDGTGTTNNPPGSDSRRQGDDQIRILKANIKQTWDSVAGPVTASHAEINRLVGVSLTDPIITLPSGAIMLFEAPASAPTGWVKKTDAAYDDVAMRISTGTLTQGGTVAFTTLFSIVTTSTEPDHTHLVSGSTGANGDTSSRGNDNSGSSQLHSHTVNITSAGAGSHNHTFDNALKYRDVYFAEKS